MALFPGATGDDILAWRGISELIGDIRNRKTERLRTLGRREGVVFLNDLKVRLDDEIAFEEQYASELSTIQEALDAGRSKDDFADVHTRFVRIAAEYYGKRGSVIALHTLCNSFRDALLRKALDLAEGQLAREGTGRQPAIFCVLAGGSIGRREQTFCADTFFQLIHGDCAAEETGWFQLFIQRAATLMEGIGLVNGEDTGPLVNAVRIVTRTGWREEIADILGRGDRLQQLELLERADLRLVFGDAALAEEMLLTVRSALGYGGKPFPEPSAAGGRKGDNSAPASLVLRGVGREIAEMQTGLDFFSRLRLEKRGRYKGKFDLEKYALLPLIANVRMLAVCRGLRETATIERIKRLMSLGCLNVDLTERLLFAYHDFCRLKINRQVAAGCSAENSRFIDPGGLTPDDESSFRNGLEAVAAVEKIVSISFIEHG